MRQVRTNWQADVTSTVELGLPKHCLKERRREHVFQLKTLW